MPLIAGIQTLNIILELIHIISVHSLLQEIICNFHSITVHRREYQFKFAFQFFNLK